MQIKVNLPSRFAKRLSSQAELTEPYSGCAELIVHLRLFFDILNRLVNKIHIFKINLSFKVHFENELKKLTVSDTTSGDPGLHVKGWGAESTHIYKNKCWGSILSISSNIFLYNVKEGYYWPFRKRIGNIASKLF